MKQDSLYLSDLGNGQYQNPVLFADYSDPDAVRVGDTYYMTASSFNYTPGLPILTSKDLVNWTLVNYALKNIPESRYAVPRHAQGVWAPAICHHDGFFYIYYGMPDEGIFMVRAKDACGVWDEPVCVLAGKGLIDPAAFWDEDGRAYVVHGYARSRIGFKSFLGIFPMNAAGTKAIGADKLLYNGLETQPTIEGPKVYSRGGYIYIFAPAGGVEVGWQTVLRSRSIYGPFEERIVMHQGDAPTNGPHQGAWVTTPDGADWFLHFQSRGLYGRIVHLQPMRWTEDGWPVIGLANANETCGIPCVTHEKPECKDSIPPCSLQASDDFSAPSLALQWQFMGNWRDDFYSLTEREDALRLYAHAAQGGSSILWNCAHGLTQKLVCPAFTASVSLDVSGLGDNAQAGFAFIGGHYTYLAVRNSAGEKQLLYALSSDDPSGVSENILSTIPMDSNTHTVHLRITLTPTDTDKAEAMLSYSFDGDHYEAVGEPFVPGRHTWTGAKLTLFSMSLAQTGTAAAGYADFTNFCVASTEAAR